MKKKPASTGQARKDRRRFLRESLRGAVPLLLGVGVDADPRPDAERTPATSPPPEASGSGVAPGSADLDRHLEEFANDNPGLTGYPED